MLYPKSTKKDQKSIKYQPAMEWEGTSSAQVRFSFFFPENELAFCHNVKVFISKTCQNSMLVTVINNHVLQFPAWYCACCGNFDLN